MTDEEKKAIEYLKRHILPCYGRKGTIEFMLNDTILNLIEKQFKEIEELKEKNEKLERKIKRVLIYLDWIDDDMLKCCSIIDVNGIDIVKILNEE